MKRRKAFLEKDRNEINTLEKALIDSDEIQDENILLYVEGFFDNISHHTYIVVVEPYYTISKYKKSGVWGFPP